MEFLSFYLCALWRRTTGGGCLYLSISKSSPSLLVPEIPSGLNSTVERATELSVVNRCESVQWIKVDLERLLES